MKINRKIIEIDEELCDGCGQCVPSCAEGALQIADGKARLVAEIYCDGLGACLGNCPTGALKITEREAEDFDEAAVEEYLKNQDLNNPQEENMCCPSSAAGSLNVINGCKEANEPVISEGGVSGLSHWPVQIRLVPPNAPFLKNADLLILADCAAVAYPGLHGELLKDRVVMMGCPKFDNAQEYIKKFSGIFRASDIRSITVAVMEVPCCQGLPVIVQRGMEAAGADMPVNKMIIGKEGKIQETGAFQAS